MNEDETSEIMDVRFITDSDARRTYEELTTRGFNRLVKVMRQGRWFLLKGLKPEFVQEPMYLDLLKKEYELSIQMDHPNIVKALYKEVDSEIGPCIVMEYVDGVTLDKFLETNPTKTVRKRVIDQILDALKYVHGKQIIHRDLKPSNILITRNGNNLKIIDFGLSDADDYAVLKQPAGSPKYIAPEQQTPGLMLDGRADIYSFGLLLKEIFPHRYRCIASKCSRADRERRYSNVEAVKKAFDRRLRWHRVSPFLGGMAMAIVISLFYVPHDVTQAESYSPEFTELLDRAEHIIDSMYNPVLVDLENDKPISEISQDFLDRVKVCRSLLQDLDSPILDDPKTRNEFITAWEHLHNDKYNLVCFRLYDKINEENAQNMNQ